MQRDLPSMEMRHAVNGNATCCQWNTRGLWTWSGRRLTGWTKGGRLHRSLPPLSRPVDSSLSTFHSSLKEYRILHSSFFILHSKSLYFVTQMDTRFMSFWLNGWTVEPLCPVVTREASMPYSVVSAFFTAAARCSDRRSLMAFVPVPASA